MADQELHLHGGVHTINEDVETLHAHGGVFYVRGKVNNLIHHGGIIYDQRRSNRIEYVADKITDDERRQYQQLISNLKERLRRSENEVLELRRKDRQEESEIPSDDVLVQRIILLRHDLERERQAHAQDVKELKERLDTALEVNAKLRRHNEERDKISQHIADYHVDILATLMALYPFTPDKDLEYEFGIPANRIRDTAKVLGQIKSPEARREAVDYLKRQHIEMIQRRGGDRGNHTNIKVVEKVARNGRVVATFDSAKDAADAYGWTDKTIREYCQDYSKKRRYTKEGYTFRYKMK